MDDYSAFTGRKFRITGRNWSPYSNAFQGRMDGIAYVRGQLPKSFVRAYLLNWMHVSSLIKKIFAYFDSFVYKKEPPSYITNYLRKRIERAMQAGNNFRNEYTLPYIQKKATASYKEIVAYSSKQSTLNIPSHFLNFLPDDKHGVEVSVYNDKELLYNRDIGVVDGGIGWKSEPLSLTFNQKKRNLRYVLRNKATKEVIYNSGYKHYQQALPKIYKVLLQGEAVEVSFDDLESGSVYKVVNNERVKISKTRVTKENHQSYFMMQDDSLIQFDGKTYKTSKQKNIVTTGRTHTWSGIEIVEDNKKRPVYKGDFYLYVLIRFPYSLNELELTINERTYNGLEIRQLFLERISIKDGADFKYRIHLAGVLKSQSLNRIEVHVKIGNVSVTLTAFSIYYSKERPLQFETYQFDGKEYFTFETDDSVTMELEKNGEVSVSVLGQNKKWVLTFPPKSETTAALSSKEFKEMKLSDRKTIQWVTDEEKQTLIKRAFDQSYLVLEEYLSELIEAADTEAFLEKVLHHSEFFIQAVMEDLEEADRCFIEEFIVGLKNILMGETIQSPLDEKYLLPFVETIQTAKINRLLMENIDCFLKKYRPDKTDISRQVHYLVKDRASTESRSLSKLLYSLSSQRRRTAEELYEIAAKLTMEERKTIRAIKEVHQRDNTKSQMEYYEIVLSFRDLLN